MNRDIFETKLLKTSTCWLWQGAKTRVGYGILRVSGRFTSPHRLSYELYKGPIPEGFFVCHSCDVRHCANPDHLWLGTCAENQQDMVQKGRGKTPFVKGKDNPRGKLSETDVFQIRQMLSNGVKQKVIAACFNVGESAISMIKTGSRRA